jgi:putative ABC transport system substrate-binding protein
MPAAAFDDRNHQPASAIIAVSGAPMAFAAKAATATIPIVFVQGLDPVQLGLVASLNRPGGNLTGVTALAIELIGKRLDLLHELRPAAASLGFLLNPLNPVAASEATNLESAARVLGLKAHVLEAHTPSELDAAFESLVGLGAGALVVGADSLFTNNRAQIVALAARHALPAIYAWRLFPAAGGLISYGADLVDTYRQAGVLTGKVLKRAKPADLPVQQAVKVELVINLKTAKALGLTIPPLIFARADEVIDSVEAFGEPAVDRGEEIAGFGVAALIAAEPGEAHSGAQFPELGSLLLGDAQGFAVQFLRGLGVPLPQ